MSETPEVPTDVAKAAGIFLQLATIALDQGNEPSEELMSVLDDLERMPLTVTELRLVASWGVTMYAHCMISFWGVDAAQEHHRNLAIDFHKDVVM